jgi:hypothetical protein
MTDDELWAEVQAMRQGGSRGESEAIEGTPEGTYLWILAHREPAVPEIGVTIIQSNVAFTYETAGVNKVLASIHPSELRPSPA